MSARELAMAPAGWGDAVRYGRHAAVGAALYHTVGDREQALRDLSISFGQLYTELSHTILGSTAEHPFGTAASVKNPAWLLWWQSVAVPVFNAWRDFKAERSSENWTKGGSIIAYGEQFSTSWDEYEAWHKRLTDLRDNAVRAGIPLITPEPQALPTTIPGAVADTAKGAASAVASGAESLWTIVKVALWATLGLGVVFAGATIIGSARGRGRR